MITNRISEVIVVCYSVADRDSFISVKSFWVPQLKALAKKRPIVLVGLQTDLRKSNNNQAYISSLEGRNVAMEIGADSFVECSSFKQDGVKDVFDSVIFACLRSRKSKLNIIKRVLGR